MKCVVIDLETQTSGVEKTADQIFAAASLLGLQPSFLGGGERFVKVCAQPGRVDKLDDLIYYVETLPYDPLQQPDPDEDE